MLGALPTLFHDSFGNGEEQVGPALLRRTGVGGLTAESGGQGASLHFQSMDGDGAQGALRGIVVDRQVAVLAERCPLGILGRLLSKRRAAIGKLLTEEMGALVHRQCQVSPDHVQHVLLAILPHQLKVTLPLR